MAYVIKYSDYPSVYKNRENEHFLSSNIFCDFKSIDNLDIELPNLENYTLISEYEDENISLI